MTAEPDIFEQAQATQPDAFEAATAESPAGTVSRFMEENYFHFNAGSVMDAAHAYKKLMESGGKMMVSLAGAMSTAELGISLAKMIRADKVHAISCTGANLEEDLFNLVAHSKYVEVNWRNLTPEDDEKLLEKGLPRVTDVCIPENAAMEKVSGIILKYWQKADKAGQSFFPYEHLYHAIRAGEFKGMYEIDPNNSWLLAACEKDLPIYVPGWEDSTLGNMYAACCMRKEVKRIDTVKCGTCCMMELCDFYKANCSGPGMGFFQIGGGIAGDFAICAVPLLKVDMKLEDEIPLWSYFCQISDSTASYGSYSGAPPNEKITWYKIGPETPRFVIESDATIVAPLIFAYVLGL